MDKATIVNLSKQLFNKETEERIQTSENIIEKETEQAHVSYKITLVK